MDLHNYYIKNDCSWLLSLKDWSTSTSDLLRFKVNRSKKTPHKVCSLMCRHPDVTFTFNLMTAKLELHKLMNGLWTDVGFSSWDFLLERAVHVLIWKNNNHKRIIMVLMNLNFRESVVEFSHSIYLQISIPNQIRFK